VPFLVAPDLSEVTMQEHVFRKHPSILVLQLICWTPFVFLIFGTFGWIAAIIGYKHDYIMVNDKGVTESRGWLAPKVRFIPFKNINSVEVNSSKSAPSGTIRVSTGNDRELICMFGVRQPYEIKQLIEAQL
jgi:hypothetical protein